MPKPKNQIIGMSAPVAITAAEGEADDLPKSFSSTFYTGGILNINGWDQPVIVDLSGLKAGNVLVANLDHDSSKRVGNFEVVNDGKSLVANGRATAATAARDEVVNSARNGYQWQASLEVNPTKIETLAKGKTVAVNGQQFEGPAYIARAGVLKGFAFVSHGADDNTTATIAAIAASSDKENKMDPKFKTWIEAMGFDADTLTPEQIAGLQANYSGKQGKAIKAAESENPFEKHKIEAKRKADMREIADKHINAREYSPDEISAIEEMYDHAVKAGMSVSEFRMELFEASIPVGVTPFVKKERDRAINNKVVEAAICQAGRLQNLEERFDERTLEAAEQTFRNGIGLKQIIFMAAKANGHDAGYSNDVNTSVLRAAFQDHGTRRPIHASGFSTLEIGSIISNTANKFLREGWNAVDMTPMRVAAIRAVRNFQQITTVSLTGDLQFEKLGAAGEIKHGTLGDEAYTNQADTYARMLAITRKDIINDDLGALTSAPRRLGRGSALKLNDIFWTAFLNNSSFFTSGRNNVNTAVADMTVGGLQATETIFMDQTDPDGKPLGIMPAILLVPTPLKSAASTLMASDKLITGASATIGEANPFAGRFRVESSPYMSNSTYTGYSAAAWYMLADPTEMPVIEIAALNGRVEPVVETAEAEFNVLGIQMRGYSDIGVSLQEYRAGVRADGGSS